MLGKSQIASASAAAASKVAALPAFAKSPRKSGIVTRFFAGGTGLSPGAARQAVRDMSGTIGGFAGGLGGGSFGLIGPGLPLLLFSHSPEVGLLLTTLGLMMAGTGLLIPRYLMTHFARRPLTLAEAEALAASIEDPTEKAYMGVVADALRQPGLPSTQTEKDVRAALQTLGEAIDKLPRVTAPHQNADDLRFEAKKAWIEADAEPDAIIAASLRRRAEAQEKTAQSAQKSALLVRRADALRREIEAQIEALRMGLSHFDVGSTDAVHNNEAAQNAAAHLSQLAQSVQGVAREAGSLTDARDEVAAWTDGTDETVPNPVQPTRRTDAAADMVTVGHRAAR